MARKSQIVRGDGSKVPQSAPNTAARETVLKALPKTKKTGTTARQISEDTGLRYSTVTEQLRALAADGLAASTRVGNVTEWRRAEATAAADGDGKGSEVGDVREFMESARPVSPAPAGAATTAGPRVRSERAVAAGFADTWGRGGLRDAVLKMVRSLPAGGSVTPTVAAKALKAQVGSVAAALDAGVKRGEIKLVVEKPKTYAAV